MMNSKAFLLALMLAAPLSAKPPAPGNASIPFANHGGIQDFAADGVGAIYLQDRANHWYRASLMGPCLDLPFAEAIGYSTGPDDSFDHFSSIVVRGHSCQVQTLDPSAPPPGKAKRKE